MSTPTPICPLRPDDPCSLCQAFVTGPQDCGLVYLVMDDPELRELWDDQRRRTSQRKREMRMAKYAELN